MKGFYLFMISSGIILTIIGVLDKTVPDDTNIFYILFGLVMNFAGCMFLGKK